MKALGFPKAEHLCLQRDVDALFSHPDGSTTVWPVRCLWKQVSSGHTQVLLSVAKRHLHHAVDRNRAKRQLREAYRLQKAVVSSKNGCPALHIALIWMADSPKDTAKIHKAVGQILHRIQQQVTTPPTTPLT